MLNDIRILRPTVDDSGRVLRLGRFALGIGSLDDVGSAWLCLLQLLVDERAWS